MQFSYSYVRTQTEEIDIPDIGNFAIEAVSDKAYTYYLVIKTYDGYSQIMEYGPSMPDFDTFPSKMDVVQRWKRIDFDQGKIERVIDEFLNNGKRKIVQAKLVDKQDAFAQCKSITDYIKYKDF